MRSSKWATAAAIGLLIFLFMQVLPAIIPAIKGESAAIGRSEAKRIALAYASERWGMDLGEGSEATITHVGDDRMAAYMTKHKLTDEYDRDWDARYPTDVYAVDLHAADGSVDRVSVHMETGAVVGWARVGDAMTDAEKAAVRDVEAQTAKALAWLKTQPEFDASSWEPIGSLTEGGSVILQSRKTGLSDAHLQLLVQPDKVLTYRYALPVSFAEEIAKQRKIADKLSMTGFLLPQIVMFVLAVIYAAACRGWTSFKRGLFLSAAFFVMYAGFMFNLRPGLRASSSGMNAIAAESDVTALLVTNVVILFIQALLTYFAAVGGDGLWRSMGRSLWPRWQDADYGIRIKTAMKQGYMLAVILLGAQSVVLTVLGLLLGSYYGSDPSQSAYNMYYPWLLPPARLVRGHLGGAADPLLRHRARSQMARRPERLQVGRRWLRYRRAIRLGVVPRADFDRGPARDGRMGVRPCRLRGVPLADPVHRAHDHRRSIRLVYAAFRPAGRHFRARRARFDPDGRADAVRRTVVRQYRRLRQRPSAGGRRVADRLAARTAAGRDGFDRRHFALAELENC
ncbi:hypothetical protein OMP38_07040 [Cohnella ginsengisoli]|uniref:Uncharacterized protein n=1 Tax=Cohnella ginsengisoli TaxID=425004 RepID=A0A9X4KF44_9BACL|nr:hypothetical protein [Cohnella ginsengisoli]MDG0790636.1 hypothetical protein [Cohnella ginsengisoli]